MLRDLRRGYMLYIIWWWEKEQLPGLEIGKHFVMDFTTVVIMDGVGSCKLKQ